MENVRLVTVQDVLHARDERARLQEMWLQRYASPLISFTMNIAGSVKVNAAVEKAFHEGVARIERELKRLHAVVLDRNIQMLFTGCEGMWAVQCDVRVLKSSLCALEEMDALGRLFDMDVVDQCGVHLSRSTERPCLICGKTGKGCARSRAHAAEELFEKSMDIIRCHFEEKWIHQVGEWAQRALLYEAVTTPKPGLVDLMDNGAHRDMDIFTFMRSAAALRPYFENCVRLGLQGESVGALQHLGMAAEEDMLRAAGVNTHKGAIFALGILCYGAGRCGEDSTLEQLLAKAAETGQYFLGQMRENRDAVTGGEVQFARYGLTGARGEAASGFATVKQLALPALEKALAAGKSVNDAGLCALMHLIAHVPDSNVIRRGGMEKMEKARDLAGQWTAGEMDTASLSALNDWFVQENISPGGSADLLAASWFLRFLMTEG